MCTKRTSKRERYRTVWCLRSWRKYLFEYGGWSNSLARRGNNWRLLPLRYFGKNGGKYLKGKVHSLAWSQCGSGQGRRQEWGCSRPLSAIEVEPNLDKNLGTYTVAGHFSNSSSTSELIVGVLSLCVQIPTSIVIAWYDSSHTNDSWWYLNRLEESAIGAACVNDEVTTWRNGQHPIVGHPLICFDRVSLFQVNAPSDRSFTCLHLCLR